MRLLKVLLLFVLVLMLAGCSSFATYSLPREHDAKQVATITTDKDAMIEKVDGKKVVGCLVQAFGQYDCFKEVSVMSGQHKLSVIYKHILQHINNSRGYEEWYEQGSDDVFIDAQAGHRYLVESFVLNEKVKGIVLDRSVKRVGFRAVDLTKDEASLIGPTAYNKEAAGQIKKNNYDQAIMLCDKAIDLAPNFADAYYNRGRAYYAKGLNDQAASDLDKAVGLDPKNVDAHAISAVAWYKMKKYRGAWVCVHKAQELGYTFPADFLEQLQKDSGRDK